MLFKLLVVLIIATTCKRIEAAFTVPKYYTLQDQEYASNFDNYVPADYNFEYTVSDPKTGDHKSQWEHRKDGVVRGVYTLLEPDGTTRYVEYYADKNGFRANVKKFGISNHQTDNQINLMNIPEKQLVSPPIQYHQVQSNTIKEYYHFPKENSVTNPFENNYNSDQQILLPPFAYLSRYNRHVHDDESKEIDSSVDILVPPHNSGEQTEIHGFTGNDEDDSAYNKR